MRLLGAKRMPVVLNITVIFLLPENYSLERRGLQRGYHALVPGLGHQPRSSKKILALPRVELDDPGSLSSPSWLTCE